MWDVGLLTESSWFRTGTVGGQVLVNAVMCFVLHKVRGISCLSENRLPPQEGLYTME